MTSSYKILSGTISLMLFLFMANTSIAKKRIILAQTDEVRDNSGATCGECYKMGDKIELTFWGRLNRTTRKANKGFFVSKNVRFKVSLLRNGKTMKAYSNLKPADIATVKNANPSVSGKGKTYTASLYTLEFTITGVAPTSVGKFDEIRVEVKNFNQQGGGSGTIAANPSYEEIRGRSRIFVSRKACNKEIICMGNPGSGHTIGSNSFTTGSGSPASITRIRVSQLKQGRNVVKVDKKKGSTLFLLVDKKDGKTTVRGMTLKLKNGRYRNLNRKVVKAKNPNLWSCGENWSGRLAQFELPSGEKVRMTRCKKGLILMRLPSSL
ncbi:MAG: hypothetical protein AAFY71_07590 [Bacteroidota bacterium]